jgi:hypothetical protein
VSTEKVDGSSGRRTRVVITALILVVIIGGGAITWSALRSSGAAVPVGPEGVVVRNVPTLAPSSTTLQGKEVDGITCRPITTAAVRYHVHAYVTVFVNGHQERLPAGIGITRPFVVNHLPGGPFYDGRLGDCLYWLHTHAYDDIVHVEAPKKQTFTLGQLFDIWRQPLTSTQVGPARGRVVAFENGRRLSGSPRAALLVDHAVIQLDVGSPVVAFRAFTFHVSGTCGQGSRGCKAG